MPKQTNNQIDFVLPWVDGADSAWQERYNKYSENKGDRDVSRFRDWNLLRYWFRSIEKFSPWFRKIFFITSGELPDWLDVNHPQLEWVKHEDYIPAEYLPTFSVNTIEMNLHRIESLSEQFVYFNDDVFITNYIPRSRFFYKNLPCDYAVMTAKPVSGGIVHMAINDLEVIDKHFDKHATIKKHFGKWFSLKYGSRIVSNILLYPWKEFSGFIDPHIPNAFLKSTLNKIWTAESEKLHQTSISKFRSNDDVNQWLIRYWQLAEGNFYPKDIRKNTLCINITDSNSEQISRFIDEQQYEIICLNDSTDIRDFEKCKSDIQKGFEKILPEKSSFEKEI